VSAAFVICVHDFPHGEVSVKVGVMKFALKRTGLHTSSHHFQVSMTLLEGPINEQQKSKSEVALSDTTCDGALSIRVTNRHL